MRVFERSGLTVYEFDPVIYPRKVWVVVGAASPDLIRGVFVNYDRTELELPGWDEVRMGTTSARLRDGGTIGVLMWVVEPPLDIEMACHDSVHAANFIFLDCGVEYDRMHDEHFAYLVGHIAKWVYEAYNDSVKGKG